MRRPDMRIDIQAVNALLLGHKGIHTNNRNIMDQLCNKNYMSPEVEVVEVEVEKGYAASYEDLKW